MTKVMSGGQLQLTMSYVEWQPLVPDLAQIAADVLTGYRGAGAVAGRSVVVRETSIATASFDEYWPQLHLQDCTKTSTSTSKWPRV